MKPMEKIRQWLFQKFFKKQIQEIKSRLEIESRHQKCLKDDLKDLQARYDEEKFSKNFYADMALRLRSQIADLREQVKQLESQLAGVKAFHEKDFKASIESKHSREIQDLKAWISERDAKIELLETEISKYKHNQCGKT